MCWNELKVFLGSLGMYVPSRERLLATNGCDHRTKISFVSTEPLLHVPVFIFIVRKFIPCIPLVLLTCVMLTGKSARG